MNRKVLGTIRSFQMFSPGERVVVGLSGGADSVTLLHLLRKLDLTLLPCHINHNLRGEEALRDQRFCEELCESLRLSLKVFSVDAASRRVPVRCGINVSVNTVPKAVLLLSRWHIPSATVLKRCCFLSQEVPGYLGFAGFRRFGKAMACVLFAR